MTAELVHPVEATGLDEAPDRIEPLMEFGSVRLELDLQTPHDGYRSQ
jgi:hypothetical protein